MLTIRSNTAETQKAVPFNPGLNQIWKNYLKFLDGQEKYKTMWWFVNLVVHANLVLFIPAFVVYYYNAPVIIVGVTVALFFANLVANMGGFGIRVTLSAFFVSLGVNIGILLYYMLR